MARSGFINESRCKTPKPSSKMKIPAKKQSRETAISFSQEELSRKPKNVKLVKPPGRGVR